MTNEDDTRVISRFDPNTPANRRFREDFRAGMSGGVSGQSDQLTGFLLIASRDAFRRSNHGQDGVLQGLSYMLKELSDLNAKSPASIDRPLHLYPSLEGAIDRFIAAADGIYSEYLRETKSIPMLTVVPWDAARQVLREIKQWPAATALNTVAQRLP